ncbi:MAG TPA: hypothetical protein VF844_16340, partial [Ktedonobacteraceae bacterium]
MPDSTNTQLAPFIERARKVLQYEQRGNHQDRVVKGGLELFVVRWADEVSAVCKHVGLDPRPIYRFTEHLEGYRRQDPMQRAASLRAALVILNELDSSGQGNHADSFSSSRGEERGKPHPTGRPQGSPLQATAPEMVEDTRGPAATGRPQGSPLHVTAPKN